MIKADQSFSVSDVNAPVGTVQADDWASAIGRPELRTFTWQLTGTDGPFAIDPSTGELRITDQRLLDEHTTYTLKARVSDGFHTSDEVTLTVATQDLANVADGDAGGSVPATLSLALGSSAGFGAFTPGVGKDYEASASATVISTAGDAALSVADPRRFARPARQRRLLARPAGAGGGLRGVRSRRRRAADAAHLQRPGRATTR